jgi:hypothetical protein
VHPAAQSPSSAGRVCACTAPARRLIEDRLIAGCAWTQKAAKENRFRNVNRKVGSGGTTRTQNRDCPGTPAPRLARDEEKEDSRNTKSTKKDKAAKGTKKDKAAKGTKKRKTKG